MRTPQREDEERFEILRELKRCLTAVLEVTSSKERAVDFIFTDDEPSAQDLLVWIERALWHGLKRFHLDEPVTLWTILKAHLAPPPEDVEAVDKVLRQVLRKTSVTTDIGRSRVWVRLALNSGVLGTSLACLDSGADVFYDTLSLWRSTEMRSIAISLLQSLNGLRFNLGCDSSSFDTDPEPSRRPHLLGVAHANSNRPSAVLFSKKASQAAIERRSELARARREVEAMRLKGASPSSPSYSSSTASVTSPQMQWFKRTFESFTQALQAPAPQASAPPPPSLIGTPLSVLVKDPRTCETALMDWRLGVPDALSAVLALIDLDESCDPFEAARAKDEDDPAFVREVGNLLARLSTRRDRPESASPAALDGRSLSSAAVAVLKLILRQLPVPLFPYDMYDALLECSRIGDPLARARNIKFLVDSLPAEHKATLARLFEVAGRVCDAGRSTPSGFAAALAPCIVRPRPGASGGLGRAQDSAEVVSIMVEQRGEVLGDVERELGDRQSRLDAKLSRLRALHDSLAKPVDPAKDAELLARLWAALGDRSESFPGAVDPKWAQRGCRGASVVDDLRGCGQASLVALVRVCEDSNEEMLGACAKHGAGSAPGTFPFVMGCAQVCRGALLALGLAPDRPFVDRKMAEQPSWVLLDEEDAPQRVCQLAVSNVLSEWDKQRAGAMDFTRIVREVFLRIEAALDDLQPESFADLEAALKPSIISKNQGPGPGTAAASPAASATQEGSALHSGGASHPGKEPDGPTGSLQPSFSTTATTVRVDAGVGAAAAPAAAPVLEPAPPADDVEDFLPRLLSPSKCITSEDVLPLEASLPVEYRGYDWQLCFSSDVHGFNRELLFSQCAKHAATLLFIRDGNHVFGGFCTEPWVPHYDRHFGTGQSFIFTFAHGRFEAFTWTKANNLFQHANDDSLAMGGGGNGFGLYIDGLDLGAGMTAKCLTYGNDKPLVPGETNSEGAVDFTCQNIEVWYFVPKSSRAHQ